MGGAVPQPSQVLQRGHVLLLAWRVQRDGKSPLMPDFQMHLLKTPVRKRNFCVTAPLAVVLMTCRETEDLQPGPSPRRLELSLSPSEFSSSHGKQGRLLPLQRVPEGGDSHPVDFLGRSVEGRPCPHSWTNTVSHTSPVSDSQQYLTSTVGNFKLFLI
ncbi:hypothetical protein H920_18975 [Fukomys damarensis]|uniref:Uncharacterized protein n=1 Tax=Fukomys damarensis TaxID=885580 RepID=A0A091CLL3_FUKDA|nr:hypothetical protein H920_18975 [Fukomys damarensis]